MDWVHWGVQREEVYPKGMERGGKIGGGSPKEGCPKYEGGSLNLKGWGSKHHGLSAMGKVWGGGGPKLGGDARSWGGGRPNLRGGVPKI